MTTTLNHHWCVGIDLHKDTLTVCTFCRCCGEVSFQKIACKCRRQIAEYFASLPRPHTVATETVGFYRWLWEMLEPVVEQLVLADATQARALAGRRLKTDREDAFNVAELLAVLVTAATVIGEIGDFSRFTHRKAIGRFAGLNPRVFASGGKQRIGHIANAGSPQLRWILQQAAWTAIRTDDQVRRIFLRIAKCSGRKAAAVAIARKLLTWMHSAVTKGETYRGAVAA